MIETRLVHAEDEALLFAIYLSTRRDEFAALGWDEGQLQTFLRLQFQAQRLSYQTQYPDANHRIILHAGESIGQIMIAQRAEGILLVDISLLPQHRNAGVGTSMIRQLQASGDPVRLHVFQSNPARRLYERLGFRVTGEAPPYLTMEWRPPNTP